VTRSREIRLKSRPHGMPTLDNFELATVEMPALDEGQVLVRNLYMTLDPAVRPMMDERESYIASYEVGQPMFGLAVGQVVESRNPAFRVGCCVVNYSGWREHFISPGADLSIVDPSLAPLPSYLYVLGLVGATAYFGMLDVGKPQPGETVFVSAAAGAIGLIACQVAKLAGCHVIGSCGSDEKVDYLLNVIGIDAAINYKKVDDIEAAVRKHAPQGIDVYFENVGGAHADAALQLLKNFGRFVVCGQISEYQDEKAAVGPKNFTLVNTKRLRIQGYLIFDYVDRLPEYCQRMGQWIAEGKVRWRETIRDGLENAPQAFLDMFQGKNIGKMMVKMGEPENLS
jgi:NADPH-dependent curcumin reductase CurA